MCRNLYHDSQTNSINKNKNIMSNLLYLLAVILIISWALGFFVYNTGNLIHILLVIAVVAILLRIISGKNIIK